MMDYLPILLMMGISLAIICYVIYSLIMRGSNSMYGEKVYLTIVDCNQTGTNEYETTIEFDYNEKHIVEVVKTHHKYVTGKHYNGNYNPYRKSDNIEFGYDKEQTSIIADLLALSFGLLLLFLSFGIMFEFSAIVILIGTGCYLVVLFLLLGLLSGKKRGQKK